MDEPKVKIVRGNVVLRVEAKDVSHYLTMGYNVVDENGKILREAIPTDTGVLQRAFVDNKQKIADLEASVASLTAECERLKKQLAKAKASTDTK